MDKRFIQIPGELIGRGCIKKCIVTSLKDVEDIVKNDQLKKYIKKLQKAGYTVEILAVAPGASVRQHYHKYEWEIRMNLRNGKTDWVKIGENHSGIENCSKEHEYYLCIKGNSELEMPNIQELKKLTLK